MSAELIRIAARLLTPEISDNPDDYNNNIPKWLIRKIGSHRDKLRDYAKSIRAEYDYYSKIEKENSELKAKICNLIEQKIELKTENERLSQFNITVRDAAHELSQEQANQIKALSKLVDEIIIETGINECRCDEAFTSRGRHESNTNCHLIGHYEKRLQEILNQ